MSGMSILKAIGTIIGVVLLLLIVFLWFWDFSRYEPEIETAVSEATGRDFRIEGTFDVDVLPSPSVLIEGATLANAGWSETPVMAEVGHAYVRVGLWSLVFRPIVIHELELTDVAVLIEANEDGAGNWEMGAPEAPVEEAEQQEEPEPGIPIDLRSASISNVRLTYRQPGSDDVEVALDTFAVATDAAEQKLVEGAGSFSGTPFAIDGSVDGAHTEFEANYGEIRLATTTDMADESLDFTATLGSLADVGNLLDVDNLPAENLELEGGLALRDATLVVSGFVASITGLRITVDGELGGESGTAALNVDIEGDSLAQLDPELPEIPFSADAAIVAAGERLEVAPFTVTFGESELSGTAEIAGGDTTVVRFEADSPRVDLRPFASDEEEASPESAPGAPQTADDDTYVFKDEPLPLDTLRGLDADVSLSIAQLLLPNSQFNNLETAMIVKEGRLHIDNTFEGAKGGRYVSGLRLDASGGDSAELEMKSDIRDLRLGLTSGPDVADDEVPATSVNLDLSASGGTPRALASSVDGRIVMTQGAGLVRNDLIERFSGDIIAQLFKALNPFAEEEEFTNWECSVLATDFESGVGEITGFLLQSEKLMVVGGGSIDLNTEALNIEFNTKPRTGVGVSADMFVTPFVKLSGTLASPSVGLNQKGLLLSGGAAFLTGGMSFLYQGLVDRATAEGGRCEEALEAVTAPAGESAGD